MLVHNSINSNEHSLLHDQAIAQPHFHNMPILLGKLTPEVYAASKVKHISRLSEVEGVRDGETIEFLGHALMYGSPGFASAKEFNRYQNRPFNLSSLTHRYNLVSSWRRVGDPLCDKAFSEILDSSFTSTGKDLLDSVQSCARECPDAAGAAAFLKEVTRPPPCDVAASAEDIRIAQDFFFDYFPQINIGLLYFAIVGGFSR